MKTYFLTIAAIFLLTQTVTSQNILDGVYTKSDEEEIKYIDNIKQEIKTNLKNFKKTETFKDSSEYTFVYRKDKELQLISKYTVFQESISVKEYYFYNRQLILAAVINTFKNSNQVGDDEKMYFDNEHLFAWIKYGSKVNPYSEEFKKAAEEVRDFNMKLRIENMN